MRRFIARTEPIASRLIVRRQTNGRMPRSNAAAARASPATKRSRISIWRSHGAPKLS